MSTNAGHALATVVVDELVRHGLKHACLGPGSRSTPLVLALYERSEISLHVCIDERSAAFVALGLAKLDSEPAAIVTTSGTAAANLYPAVIEASFAQVPMIVLTADRPPELRDTGAGQTIDQIKLYGGAVRWFCEVGAAESRPGMVRYWRSLASRAVNASRGPEPGPVHLNLAFRDPLVPEPDEQGFAFALDGRPDGEPWTGADPVRTAPSEGDVQFLLEKIHGAARGVIAAGTGALPAEPILEVARRAGWPVLAEATSNVRTAEPAITVYEGLLRDSGFAAGHRPDLVIRVGRLGTSPSLARWLDASIPQVSVDPTASLDPNRAVSRVVRADPGLLFEAVADRLGRRPDSPWLKSWLDAERAARSAVDRVLDSSGLSEPRLARDLADCLPDGSVLYAASSMPVRELDWFMRLRPRLRLLANRGANGIDGFVSSALGAAISHSGPLVALSGDLSFLYDQNGLLLASGGSLDVVFVVVNNDGGGIFNFLPQAGLPGFERLFGTPHGLDFTRLAGFYGCGYQQVHDPFQLAPAVRQALDAGGVQVIEARTAREENVALHRLLWQSVAGSIATE